MVAVGLIGWALRREIEEVKNLFKGISVVFGCFLLLFRGFIVVFYIFREDESNTRAARKNMKNKQRGH